MCEQLQQCVSTSYLHLYDVSARTGRLSYVATRLLSEFHHHTGSFYHVLIFNLMPSKQKGFF